MSSRQETGVSPITDIIGDLKAGRMVVLVDEADRENEGDLLIAAEFATPEKREVEAYSDARNDHGDLN